MVARQRKLRLQHYEPPPQLHHIGAWQRWGDEGWHDAFGEVGRPAGVPDEAEYWYLHCPHLFSFGMSPVTRGHWSTTGGRPTRRRSAQELVLPAWAHVRGLLQEPDLLLTPDQGAHSIIFIPTFVAIGNPQPSTTYTAAAGGGVDRRDADGDAPPRRAGAPAAPSPGSQRPPGRAYEQPRRRARGARPRLRPGVGGQARFGGWSGRLVVA